MSRSSPRSSIIFLPVRTDEGKSLQPAQGGLTSTIISDEGIDGMAVKTIRKKSILPGYKGQPEIIDPRSLKHLLHAERERSNRSGSPFSFLRFTVKESVAADSIPSGFIRELFDRVRAIDTVGWMEDGGIGVILPYTPASGARILAHELLELPETGNPPINYTIYTYPFSMVEE